MDALYGGGMMRYSVDAWAWKLGLWLGLVEPAEVVAWADGVLARDAYDDGVADVALGVKASRMRMMALLVPLTDPADEVAGMRRMLGRMYEALRAEPARAETFAWELGRWYVGRKDQVPSDLLMVACLDEEFSLIPTGYGRTLEEVTWEMLEWLRGFVKRQERSW